MPAPLTTTAATPCLQDHQRVQTMVLLDCLWPFKWGCCQTPCPLTPKTRLTTTQAATRSMPAMQPLLQEHDTFISVPMSSSTSKQEKVLRHAACIKSKVHVRLFNGTTLALQVGPGTTIVGLILSHDSPYCRICLEAAPGGKLKDRLMVEVLLIHLQLFRTQWLMPPPPTPTSLSTTKRPMSRKGKERALLTLYLKPPPNHHHCQNARGLKTKEDSNKKLKANSDIPALPAGSLIVNANGTVAPAPSHLVQRYARKYDIFYSTTWKLALRVSSQVFRLNTLPRNALMIQIKEVIHHQQRVNIDQPDSLDIDWCAPKAFMMESTSVPVLLEIGAGQSMTHVLACYKPTGTSATALFNRLLDTHKPIIQELCSCSRSTDTFIVQSYWWTMVFARKPLLGSSSKACMEATHQAMYAITLRLISKAGKLPQSTGTWIQSTPEISNQLVAGSDASQCVTNKGIMKILGNVVK
ncbi:hypothetical protein BDR26DRAFT_955736, partial [Obelidium mucronatum]